MAHAGERMVPLVLKGKTVQVVGSADQLHSFTYVPDLAAAMIAAARRPDLWNSVLHAPTNPALTQRGLATAYATAAGLPAPKVTAIPGWVVRWRWPGVQRHAGGGGDALSVRAAVRDGLGGEPTPSWPGTDAAP